MILHIALGKAIKDILYICEDGKSEYSYAIKYNQTNLGLTNCYVFFSIMKLYFQNLFNTVKSCFNYSEAMQRVNTLTINVENKKKLKIIRLIPN